MKNAFCKDFFRLIWQTRSRFLAIMAFVALGAGICAGLESAAPDMRRAVDAYLDEYRTMDLRVISPLGLVDDDIDAIRQTEGVAAVLPAYSVDAVINLTGKDCGLEERAPMCGVPYHAVDSYLSRLVQKG